MATSRRDFLKLAGALGAAGATGVNTARASSITASSQDSWGMLTDLTLCIGCRKCEFACKQTNGLSNQPIESFQDESVFERKRRTDANNLTVVNRFNGKNHDTDFDELHPTSATAGLVERGGDGAVHHDMTHGTATSRVATADVGHPTSVHVKKQCMHCIEPACVSACPVAAMRKTAQGPVIYDASTCMGCRYCMVACPFSIPAYTYDEPLKPVVRKCSMCFEAVSARGEVPACMKICPVEAIRFGKRGALLALAREKISQSPEKYVSHIYGEHEVGGTCWLYVGPRPFNELGFRADLGTRSYPELSAGFMSVVPFVVTSWPAVLLGAYALTKSRANEVARIRAELARTTASGNSNLKSHREDPPKGA